MQMPIYVLKDHLTFKKKGHHVEWSSPHSYMTIQSTCHTDYHDVFLPKPVTLSSAEHIVPSWVKETIYLYFSKINVSKMNI